MPSHTADSEVQPYTPTFAQEVTLVHDWTGIVNKYVSDTGNGSLQAKFAMLELGNKSNMVAASNLLRSRNKDRLLRNTKFHAQNLIKTRNAADSKQTKEAADAHQQQLQPQPDRVNKLDYILSHRIAIVAFEVVMAREEAHSKEFVGVRGQHNIDSGVLIDIIFEAMLDHHNGAHEGYFVRKFSIGLPGNRHSPISPSPSSSTMLPFTPKVALFLQDDPNKIKAARRYLEHSHLFSQINLLGLSSRAAREIAAKFLSTDKGIIQADVIKFATQAANYLYSDAFGSFDPGASQEVLLTRLIKIAAGLVHERRRDFPMEFLGAGTIGFNLRTVIAVIFEVLTAHSDEGSYFHRKLAAASGRAATSKSAITSSKGATTPESGAAFKSVVAAPKSVAASKSGATFEGIAASNSVTTPKRKIAQTNTTSANGESSNVVAHEYQPVKKRKKQTSRNHNDHVPKQVQEAAENDTLEARDTHLENVESDLESSLFIPEAPVAASSDKSFEAFDKAFEEVQKKSVFNQGNGGPPSVPPTTSSVSALPTIHAPTPVSSGRLRLRGHAMHPILGQKQYKALNTDFEVVAQAYNTLKDNNGNLEKAREIAELQSSVDELRSENEVLHCVVEETSEENAQLRALVEELREQQGGTARR